MEYLMMSIFSLLAGIWCIVASIKDWDFFFNARKSRNIVKIIGRKGARIFYSAIGVLLMFASIMIYTTGA